MHKLMSYCLTVTNELSLRQSNYKGNNKKLLPEVFVISFADHNTAYGYIVTFQNKLFLSWE